MERQGLVGVMGTEMGLDRLMRVLTRWLCNWEMTKYEIYRVLFRYC